MTDAAVRAGRWRRALQGGGVIRDPSGRRAITERGFGELPRPLLLAFGSVVLPMLLLWLAGLEILGQAMQRPHNELKDADK